MATESSVLTPKLEDYLEAVARLVEREGEAHASDIAEAVSVHISTVSTAMKSLSEKGLVRYRPYQTATLTEKGKRVGEQLIQKRRIVSRFLSDILRVDPDVAEDNACRMEHVLDEQVMEHLVYFARFVKECPRAGEDWLERFTDFVEHDGQPPDNRETPQSCLNQLREKFEERRKGDKNAMRTLDDLNPGQTGIISDLDVAPRTRQRLLDMGAVRGTPVEVVKVAPMGDPVEVKIKGYSLTLRKEEARGIIVEGGDE
ncbi:MAG: DtxR family transcriptional regulator [Planctomycetota bacterium]